MNLKMGSASAMAMIAFCHNPYGHLFSTHSLSELMSDPHLHRNTPREHGQKHDRCTKFRSAIRDSSFSHLLMIALAILMLIPLVSIVSTLVRAGSINCSIRAP